MSIGNTLKLFNDEQLKKISGDKVIPEFRSGYTLSIKYLVQGSDSRTQIFTGLCIAKRNRGLHSSFVLRKLSAASIYVEKHFNLHSPSIQSIEIKKRGKVRRAKLFYMRKLTGKATRITKEYKSY